MGTSNESFILCYNMAKHHMAKECTKTASVMLEGTKQLEWSYNTCSPVTIHSQVTVINPLSAMVANNLPAFPRAYVSKAVLPTTVGKLETKIPAHVPLKDNHIQSIRKTQKLVHKVTITKLSSHGPGDPKQFLHL